jgi:hypothetical protein
MTVVSPLLSPALRARYRGWADEAESVAPRPGDAPHVRVDGPSAVRVLILGGGPAVGYGVSSHTAALTGRLALAVREIGGRGASVHARAAAGARIADAAGLLDPRGARGYDAVVHVSGFADACFGTPSNRPFRDLMALVDALRATGGPDLAVVLAGIEPPLGRFQDRLAGLLAARVDRVNEQIAAVAAEVRPSAYVRIPARSEVFPYRTAAGYRAAAEALAPALLGALRQASEQAASGVGARVPLRRPVRAG